MSTTLRSKDVTIRKPHTCFSCLRKFEAGTFMNYWAGIYEGDFCTSYSCMTCQEIMSLDSESDIGFPEGYVSEWLDKGQTPEQLLEQIKLKKLKNSIDYESLQF